MSLEMTKFPHIYSSLAKELILLLPKSVGCAQRDKIKLATNSSKSI